MNMKPHALAALMLLAAPSPLFAAEGGWNALFSVEPGLMIWTVLVFGVLLFVLTRFAWKPMLAALDAREKGIQDAIDQANRQRAESEKLLAEQKEQLAEARREAQKIVADSRQSAEELRRELTVKAQEEGQAIVANARQEIQREKDAAVESIRRESVDIALAAASRLLAERMDQDKDRELVAGYIDQLAGENRAEA